jgi:hypothetical protein
MYRPTIPLSTTRASAPTAVVSSLIAIHLIPAITVVNHPPRIVSSQLSKLPPTCFITQSNPPSAEEFENDYWDKVFCVGSFASKYENGSRSALSVTDVRLRFVFLIARLIMI